MTVSQERTPKGTTLKVTLSLKSSHPWIHIDLLHLLLCRLQPLLLLISRLAQKSLEITVNALLYAIAR